MFKQSLLTGDQRLLLIFLFASDEELRLLMMHPELLSADTTFGTNDKNKELFAIAGLCGNNKGFNGCKAFILSARGWVFFYMFRYCLPLLWGEDICKRVRLVITDGCAEEYLSFLNSQVSSLCVCIGTSF
jgi:hypothetical protein